MGYLLRACWLALFLAICRAAPAHSPVILLPGLAGSVLEAKLNRTEVPSILCSKQHDWEVEWLSLKAALRPQCLLDELTITYDPVTKSYNNQEGIEIRPYDFGGLGGIYSIDPDLPGFTATYRPIIEKLKDAGYTENQDLFGAPYDFRLAGDGLESSGHFDKMRALIEHAVKVNDGKPAVLVAHSMGCLVSLYFITRQSADWRFTYLKGLVAISAPWEGSITALKGSISGDNFDIPRVPHDLLRPIQSTAPAGPWLFPTPDIWQDKVVVETQGGDQYTAKDIEQMLRDLHLLQQADVYEVTRDLTYPVPLLDLQVYCLYGYGVETDEGYLYAVDHFNNSVPPAPSKTQHGDGDGTVNLASLQACTKLGPQVVVRTYKGAEHTEILTNDDAVADLLDILTEDFRTAPGILQRFWGMLPNFRTQG
ncbi:hypothetical protein ABBQ38_002426 [Trebouxia sp. C0009 RCD-2024]